MLEGLLLLFLLYHCLRAPADSVWRFSFRLAKPASVGNRVHSLAAAEGSEEEEGGGGGCGGLAGLFGGARGKSRTAVRQAESPTPPRSPRSPEKPPLASDEEVQPPTPSNLPALFVQAGGGGRSHGAGEGSEGGEGCEGGGDNRGQGAHTGSSLRDWDPGLSSSSAATAAGRLTLAMRHVLESSTSLKDRCQSLEDAEDALRVLGAALPEDVRRCAWDWHARQTDLLQRLELATAARREVLAFADEVSGEVSGEIASALSQAQAQALAQAAARPGEVAGVWMGARTDLFGTSAAAFFPGSVAPAGKARPRGGATASPSQLGGPAGQAAGWAARLYEQLRWQATRLRQQTSEAAHDDADAIRQARRRIDQGELDRLAAEHVEGLVACEAGLRKARASGKKEEVAAWTEALRQWKAMQADIDALREAAGHEQPGRGAAGSRLLVGAAGPGPPEPHSAEPDCEPPPSPDGLRLASRDAQGGRRGRARASLSGESQSSRPRTPAAMLSGLDGAEAVLAVTCQAATLAEEVSQLRRLLGPDRAGGEQTAPTAFFLESDRLAREVQQWRTMAERGLQQALEADRPELAKQWRQLLDACEGLQRGVTGLRATPTAVAQELAGVHAPGSAVGHQAGADAARHAAAASSAPGRGTPEPKGQPEPGESRLAAAARCAALFDEELGRRRRRLVEGGEEASDDPPALLAGRSLEDVHALSRLWRVYEAC